MLVCELRLLRAPCCGTVRGFFDLELPVKSGPVNSTRSVRSWVFGRARIATGLRKLGGADVSELNLHREFGVDLKPDGCCFGVLEVGVL